MLAGGTDIVPNLKYGMYDTTRLVALRGLSRELRYVREEEGFFKLGALCTIDELSVGAAGVEDDRADPAALQHLLGPQDGGGLDAVGGEDAGGGPPRPVVDDEGEVGVAVLLDARGDAGGGSPWLP